jgi:hypothetical protein
VREACRSGASRETNIIEAVFSRLVDWAQESLRPLLQTR